MNMYQAGHHLPEVGQSFLHQSVKLVETKLQLLKVFPEQDQVEMRTVFIAMPSHKPLKFFKSKTSE